MESSECGTSKVECSNPDIVRRTRNGQHDVRSLKEGMVSTPIVLLVKEYLVFEQVV